MKVNELGENTVLDNIAIRLPDEVLQEFKDFAGGEPVMYFVGPVMGYGAMMSPQPATQDDRQLYPLPPGVNTSDILEWEVVDG